VRNLREVVDDPQSAARDMFVEVEHSSAGRVRVTGAPLKFSATPGQVLTAAPVHGEHTRQALSDILGMGGAAIDELIAAGVATQA